MPRLFHIQGCGGGRTSRMKVYIVMYDDGGNAYVEAVYSDRAKISKKYLGSMIYDIDEWEVKEEEAEE
jgi:hypothetical protein